MFYSGDHRRIYSYITQWKTERVCEYVGGYRERVRAREKICEHVVDTENERERERRYTMQKTTKREGKHADDDYPQRERMRPGRKCP